MGLFRSNSKINKNMFVHIVHESTSTNVNIYMMNDNIDRHFQYLIIKFEIKIKFITFIIIFLI